MVRDSRSVGAALPYLTQEYETRVPNLFIAGELGGLALIKNAVNQGRDCVDIIANRLTAKRRRESSADREVYDILIVGAGPAGISASLRAIEKNLKYITLERDEILFDGAQRCADSGRSEEHTSELQSHLNLVCRLLLG